MAIIEASVLLLGSEASSSWLNAYLSQRGCHCVLAESISSRPMVGKYLLIVNTKLTKIAHSSLREIQTEGRHIFSALPVESGCWWLPVVRDGRPCFGEPALRSAEFKEALDQILARGAAGGANAAGKGRGSTQINNALTAVAGD
jgi:hypothetical protein